MRVAGFFVLVLTIAFGAQLVGSQGSSQPDQTTTIRVTTGEVLLDVVVRDKHHRLVTDLRPEEMEVYEDGVRQDVKTFRVVAGAEQLQSERTETQAKTKEVATGVQPSTPSKRLEQVNFVSIVFGPVAPLNREFAREAVTDFLKSDSLPNTFVTLYSLGHSLSLIQPYTTDKNLLSSLVDRVSRGVDVPGADTSASSASTAIANAIQNSASANITQPPSGNPDPMAGQFGGAIATSPLWARDASGHDASTNLGAALEAQALLSLALRFDASEGMNTIDALRQLVRSQEKLPGRKVVLYLSDGLAYPYDRREAVDNLISLANRSGVTFYTVDTRGLQSAPVLTSALASQGMVGADSAQGMRPVTGPIKGHREMDDVEVAAVATRQLNAQDLAESTGGFAVANTNQIAEPMQRVMEDIRKHYELSYVPTSTKYDGHFRTIEVRLSRPKLSVQTRKGYYALPVLNGDALQAFEMEALNKINARPVPTDLPYDAALLKFRANDNLVEYMLAFEVPVSGLKPVPVAKTNVARVRASLVALVRDSSGDVVDKVSRELWRDLPAGASQSADHILYTQPLVLPHGSYRIDAVVTDEQSGNASVHRLAVPPDPRVGLRLSSITVVGKVEPLNRERDALNPFELDNARIIPELSDGVSSSGPVTLYFILYPAKDLTAGAELVLEILRDGVAISRQKLNVPYQRPDGSVPIVCRISPGPGSYALILTARQGRLLAESSRSLEIR